MWQLGQLGSVNKMRELAQERVRQQSSRRAYAYGSVNYWLFCAPCIHRIKDQCLHADAFQYYWIVDFQFKAACLTLCKSEHLYQDDAVQTAYRLIDIVQVLSSVDITTVRLHGRLHRLYDV